MNPGAFQTLVAKEFREAVRSRWLIGFGSIFCILAVGISWIGTLSSAMRGFSGFGRTSAALVNLVLLVVPLMGLTLGAMSLAGERERRTLEQLLVLPIRPGEVFWAKVAGLSAALCAALTAAFALSGLVLAFRGGLGNSLLYAASLLATLLLALASLSLGLCISACSRRTAAAVGAALLAWFFFVFLSDLGLLGTSLAVRLHPEALLASAWFNPLTLYRLLAVDSLGGHLDMLGPAGQCAQDFLGAWFGPAALAGLCGWLAVALLSAYGIYRRDPLREN